MCRFSDESKKKLGNAVLYIAQHAKYPYKTEVLKLLFLMEERMVQQYHVPFLAIPFSVWRLGPVSVDVFQELSDGPVLLDDYISIQVQNGCNKVLPKKEFDDDEFSDAEIEMMDYILQKYGNMTSEQLINETHKPGSLWEVTAKEHGLLEDFEAKRANSSSVILDMGKQLFPDAREYYEESLAIRQTANQMRIQ